MTKVVTATAALQLADEGQLDLDAPAATYLDDLRAPGPRQPTVRDLLAHTSGLANPVPLRWARLAGAEPPDPGVMLRRLLGRRRAYRHAVGGPPRYSNVGYLALGQIIATVTTRPFETHIRRAVLGPTGMLRTGFTSRDDADVALGTLRAPRMAAPLLRRLLPAGVVGPRHGTSFMLNRFHVDGSAYGPVWEAPPAEWDRVLAVNLGGVVNGLRAFVPRLLAAGAPGQPPTMPESTD